MVDGVIAQAAAHDVWCAGGGRGLSVVHVHFMDFERSMSRVHGHGIVGVGQQDLSPPFACNGNEGRKDFVPFWGFVPIIVTASRLR